MHIKHILNMPRTYQIEYLRGLTTLVVGYEISDTKVCRKHFNLFYFMGNDNYVVIYGVYLWNIEKPTHLEPHLMAYLGHGGLAIMAPGSLFLWTCALSDWLKWQQASHRDWKHYWYMDNRYCPIAMLKSNHISCLWKLQWTYGPTLLAWNGSSMAIMLDHRSTALGRDYNTQVLKHREFWISAMV